MNGADYMVKCLEEEGVEILFGYPGVAICPFFQSITKSDIKKILIRTEQNAAHAASGLARVTGKVGVCAVTSGPGATNLITGIATAFADSIPLICISGQVDSEILGSDVFQEADITGATESFVKYSYLVKDANDIPQIFKEAFHIASTGRKGPVLIDIPIDIQNQIINTKFKYPEVVNIRSYKPTVKGNSAQIKKVIVELKKARRPVICAGGGVILSDAISEFHDFIDRYKIPVVSTMMGIGVMPGKHPLYYGMLGNAGEAYANLAMRDADMIIMVGARVGDRAVKNPGLISNSDVKVLVHMDVDPAEIGKNAGPTIPLVGDAKSILSELINSDCEVDYSEWIDTMDNNKKQLTRENKVYENGINPAEFIRILSSKLDKNSVYVADVGQNQIWSCLNHEIKDGSFLTTGGMGTMGYSIPAAMGAKLGAPNRQVVAVCGDGAFQMSMMELATIKQHNVDVKIIVLCNNYLGMVREFQETAYKGNYSMVDLTGSPDLSKIADAYDMEFMRIDINSDIGQALDRFLASDNAVLAECIIDPMARTN